MKISDVLWRAANECLISDLSGDDGRHKWFLEFYAIRQVTNEKAALEFLKELGGTAISSNVFKEFKMGPRRQQARYNWLMFAYEVAVEEGL